MKINKICLAMCDFAFHGGCCTDLIVRNSRSISNQEKLSYHARPCIRDNTNGSAGAYRIMAEKVSESYI